MDLLRYLLMFLLVYISEVIFSFLIAGQGKRTLAECPTFKCIDINKRRVKVPQVASFSSSGYYEPSSTKSYCRSSTSLEEVEEVTSGIIRWLSNAMSRVFATVSKLYCHLKYKEFIILFTFYPLHFSPRI